MYRTALRTAPRRIASKPLVNTSRRLINTAPPTKKSRSWKSSLGRWGLAGAGIYWYNTSPVFKGIEGDALLLGETTEDAIQSVNESLHNIQESDQPTLDAIVAEKRLRESQQAEANKKSESQFEQVASAEGEAQEEGEGGLSGLEEEAGQQGAFNPETGEINWDCPCLGGMAHGPCGPEFKAAFSCFVYSTEEPKGVECIEKFKGMQDCFRAHPEIYGSELEDDEEELEEEIRAQEAARTEAGSDIPLTTQKLEEKETDSQVNSTPKQSAPDSRPAAGSEVTSKEATEKASQETSKSATQSEQNKPKPASVESEEVLPKAAYDASK